MLAWDRRNIADRADTMDDIRWFAPNDYTRLIVSDLRSRGLTVATDGDRPARLVVTMSGSVAREGWRYAGQRRVPVVQYVWDLKPWWIGRGRWDPMWSIRGRLLRLPRLGRRYRHRRGSLSALHYVAGRAAAVWAPSASSRSQVEEQLGVPSAVVPTVTIPTGSNSSHPRTMRPCLPRFGGRRGCPPGQAPLRASPSRRRGLVFSRP